MIANQQNSARAIAAQHIVACKLGHVFRVGWTVAIDCGNDIHDATDYRTRFMIVHHASSMLDQITEQVDNM